MALEGRYKGTKKHNKSNAEVVKTALFFMHSCEIASVTTHANSTHIHPQLLTTEQKHQMYTSIQPYILFALTAFQQLLFPMQMSRLAPTPNRGEVI